MRKKHINVIFLLLMTLVLVLSVGSLAWADEISADEGEAQIVEEQAEPADDADAGIMLTSSGSGSSISVDDNSARLTAPMR